MVELSVILADLECPTIIVTHSVDEAVFWSSHIVLLSERPGTIITTLEHDAPFPRTIQYMASDIFQSLSAKCREVLFNYKNR